MKRNGAAKLSEQDLQRPYAEFLEWKRHANDQEQTLYVRAESTADANVTVAACQWVSSSLITAREFRAALALAPIGSFADA